MSAPTPEERDYEIAFTIFAAGEDRVRRMAHALAAARQEQREADARIADRGCHGCTDCFADAPGGMHREQCPVTIAQAIRQGGQA